MTQIYDLKKLLNDRLDVFEEEMSRMVLPDLTFDPVSHPLDDSSWLAPAKMFEARRASCATLEMLLALIKPTCQTLYEVSRSLQDDPAFNPSMLSQGPFGVFGLSQRSL